MMVGYRKANPKKKLPNQNPKSQKHPKTRNPRSFTGPKKTKLQMTATAFWAIKKKKDSHSLLGN
jgi:hypothetical protein